MHHALVGNYVYIIGAGGFARETAALARDLGWEVVDMLGEGRRAPLGAACIPAIGKPSIRAAAVAENPDAVWRTAIHPSVITHPSVSIGKGSVVCAGNILTCDIEVGAFAQINMNCTIGHDAVIGGFVTISPGAHISGNVTIEDGAFIGSGAVIREGTRVGMGAVVGAGAVVLNDVPPRTTVVGVPAR